MNKPLLDLQVAIGVLEGSQILAPDEEAIAHTLMETIDEHESFMLKLFEHLNDEQRRQKSALLSSAKTLTDEFAALREVGFWLLRDRQHLQLEKALVCRLEFYRVTKRLIEIIQKKDADICKFEDLPALPDLSCNLYLQRAGYYSGLVNPAVYG
ncbi:MAG: hypothetical protein ABIZ04_21460 [Opitutus sp.]